jgi:hypothetical protein
MGTSEIPTAARGDSDPVELPANTSSILSLASPAGGTNLFSLPCRSNLIFDDLGCSFAEAGSGELAQVDGDEVTAESSRDARVG